MEQKRTISIYRERKSGNFRIQPFGRLPNGSSQPFGQQGYLASTASNDQLKTAMLENLAKNDRQVYEESLISKISPEEQKRVFSEEQLISIYALGSQYRIIPFRKMGNSFGSIDDMVQVVSSGEFADKGGEIVRQLFEEIP
jgi:hypothetical protein